MFLTSLSQRKKKKKWVGRKETNILAYSVEKSAGISGVVGSRSSQLRIAFLLKQVTKMALAALTILATLRSAFFRMVLLKV